jgi:2-phospho-L-lactate guanylyltransferase
MHVLVPVKASVMAKSRLSAVLDAEGRAQLITWMLERVLRAVAGAAVSRPSLVGGDERTVAIARRYGARIILEDGHGLNAALSRAMAAVRRLDRPACMLLAADLPWLAREDVEALIAASHDGRTAVIAPAQDHQGTNALVVPEGCAFTPAFGPGSCARHHYVLAQQGFPAVEVCRPGLAFDVDLPVDLAGLVAAMPAGESARWQRRIRRPIPARPTS